MSNVTRIILIWGAAILAYLFITNARGTTSVLTGLQGFAVGTTKALQGRG